MDVSPVHQSAQVSVEGAPLRRLNGEEIFSVISGARIAQSQNPTGAEPREESFDVNGGYTLWYREPAVGSISGKYAVTHDRLCINTKVISCFFVYTAKDGAFYRQSTDPSSMQRPERIYIIKGGRK